MKKIKVEFKKLHPDAKVPFKKHEGDAGYDVFSVENKYLIREKTTPVATGICLKMPKGYYCEIHTRSSQGVQGVKNHLGIIDEGYHGEITILMNAHNIPLDGNYVTIKKGDKIAQLIFKERVGVSFKEVAGEFKSSRGTKGFGSTGR